MWSPFDGQRTLVRASAGRFYDRVPLRALANALLPAGNTTDLSQLRQVNVSLSPAQAGAPAFPDILPQQVATTALVNLTTMDRGLQNAFSDQASIEVERQLGAAATVSLGYHHLRGRRLIMQINQNVPACAVAGSNNGCRPNPAFANQNQYSSAGSSVYDGLRRSVLQLADRSVRSLEGPGAVRRRPAAPVGGERDESSTASSSREMWERAARSRRPASG